ncbi:hypothetical protein [Aquimarina pacifica]|uniref:hypothetical protein n=1 Tax=Aquimarina pacifica TaxID=1296415 RepID=UPI00047293DE|nr:hypothetical protein [Aquimarina pacifica]
MFSFRSAAQDKVTPDDLRVLLGEWSGTLTYIDYSSNKPFSMPADLIVDQGKDEYQLQLTNKYPNESSANSKEKITIAKNGMQINKVDIKSREELPEGQVKIIVEYKGKDNDKNALIKKVYIIGKTQLVIRKEVKFDNSITWLTRSEYKYSR